MNLSFNYYHKLDDVEFYLCNPDGRELFPIVAKDRTVTLRFNDLSVIEFTLPAKLEKSDGTVIEKVEYYDYVETMRLIFATKIGWFKIVNVTENDDGVTKSKSVTAESLQTTFKDRGFLSEERVYKFYNPDDPTDSTYNASDDGAIPSVVGQLATQLGIRLDLNQGLDEPEQPYDEWTITYINEHLYYTGAGSTCRTFTEGVTYGYDWMVNDVEDAFEVIFVFDFMNRAIQIKAVSEVATRSNLCFSFSNFMNSVEVVEDASNITTVLSCSGNGVDITGVNPTGTNYIVDFSYYMDKVRHRWMSDALIAKLEAWKTEVEANKENYTKLVSQLRSQYASRTSSNTNLTMISTELQDLKNARDKYITAEATNSSLTGVVAAEAVEIGETSDDTTSDYNTSAFSATSQIEAHSTLPHFDTGTNKWTFNDAGITDTATNCFNLGYYYFIDSDDQSSYCRLTGKASIDPESNTAIYSCGGFTRYVEYAKVNAWIKIKEAQVASVNSSINSSNASIASTTAQLNAISSKLNLLKYLSSTPALLRELNCYWIEGEYVNENIAVLDNTTPEEEIDLANELLETGEMELSKVCQPRLSFTLEASNALTRYEFRSQMREIELGKIITVEKEEGLWYYPALLEMTFSLDDVEDFDMVFANAFRLDDWGYTYADLISDASETSRQISANWQDLMKYSKERAEVSDLIKNPLDTTLRAAFANMVNQEFITDDTGILGRKFKFEGSEEFEDEQIRIINNVILFTDDGWETIKTALGKIYYTDSEGNDRVEYGLIGETIIGRLLMGEKLEILNKNSTVKIDGSGILIKKPIYAEDGTLSEYQTMFEANADTGKLYVLEAEITGNIKGGTINISNNFLVDDSGNVTIKKGSININDNFIVDNDGNVQLNGSIVWGTGNSPTQIVYSNTALAKPADGTKWSSFPETDGGGWHRKYVVSDYFASYTYDGGNTWTDAVQIAGINGQDGADGANGANGADGADGKDGADGSDGNTIQIVYLYYRKTSSSAPSKPSYTGGSTLPTGWTLLPSGVTSTYMYEFISQCTVTNGAYGSWSTPVLWAKYGANGADGADGKDGADGSDASVTYTNVFNALTNNGTTRGCFTALNGELFINASYINTGILTVEDSGGTLFSADVYNKTVVIGGWVVSNHALYYSVDNGDGTITGTGIQAPHHGIWSIAVGYDSEASWANAPFRVSHSGKMYATGAVIGAGSSIGGFVVGADGNLSLSTTSNMSNFFDITKTYSSTTYNTRVSTAAIQLSREKSGTTHYMTLDVGGINSYPQLCFGYGGVYSGISFRQYNATYMQVCGSSSNFIIQDCGFGVYNGGYHLGITGQIRIQTTTGNHVFMRIDKGVITGLSQSEYSGYTNYSNSST